MYINNLNMIYDGGPVDSIVLQNDTIIINRNEYFNDRGYDRICRRLFASTNALPCLYVEMK